MDINTVIAFFVGQLSSHSVPKVIHGCTHENANNDAYQSDAKDEACRILQKAPELHDRIYSIKKERPEVFMN